MELLAHKKFSFHSSALPENALTVVQFTGDEGLSRLYAFDIQLVSHRLDLDLQEMLNRPATFAIHPDGGDPVRFHGMLSEFEQLNEFDGLGFYRARLVPRLWWLSITRHNQVFLGKTVPAFLQEVLVDGGLSTADFEFRLKADYEPKEFVCQYRESHFEFLSRWLEREGICYFFEQGDASEKLVFTDSQIGHKDVPRGGSLTYSPTSGLGALKTDASIRTFSCRSQVIPSRVLLKDYDYRKPSLDLEGRADLDDKGKGLVYVYGEHFRSPSEGDRLAGLRKEELLCRRNQFRGTGSVPFMAPGFLFQLARHFRKDYNRKYLTLELHHEGSQAGAFSSGLQKALAGQETAVFYRNDFLAIPSDVQFRPPRETPAPRISGFLTAKVDAAGAGEYAELDEHGRYKVQLPFDLSGRKEAKASAYLRMAQPYAGADHGMHFPLHKGTEVMLTFLDGNPDRPVIASAVPNAATPSIVQGINQTKNRIVSAAGNEIHLEDQAGSERILMHVPAKNSFVRLGAPNDPDISGTTDTSRYSSNDDLVSAHDGIRIVAQNQMWLEVDTSTAPTLKGGAMWLMGNAASGVASGFPSDDDLERIKTQVHATSHPPATAPSPANPANPANTATYINFTFTSMPCFSYQDGAVYSFARGPAYEVRTSGGTITNDRVEVWDDTAATAVPPPGGLTYASATDPRPAWAKVNMADAEFKPGTTLVDKRYGDAYSYAEGNTITVRKGNLETYVISSDIHDRVYSGTTICLDHTYTDATGTDIVKSYDNSGNLVSQVTSVGTSTITNCWGAISEIDTFAGAKSTITAFAGASSELNFAGAARSQISICLAADLTIEANLLLKTQVEAYVGKINIEGGVFLFDLKGVAYHLEKEAENKYNFATLQVMKDELKLAFNSITVANIKAHVVLKEFHAHFSKLTVLA